MNINLVNKNILKIYSNFYVITMVGCVNVIDDEIWNKL